MSICLAKIRIIFALALSGFGLVVSAINGVAATSPEVFLNKRGVTRDGVWAFSVGGKNTLEVRGVENAASLSVELLAPTGARIPIAAKSAGAGTWVADLGPLLAGLDFSYRDGLVFATGYGLEISTIRGEEVTSTVALQQVPAKRFVDWKYGDPIVSTTAYLATAAPRAFRFNPAHSPGTIVDFFLGDAVLFDNSHISVRAGLRSNAPAANMDFQLKVVDAAGGVLKTRAVKLEKGRTQEIDTFSTKSWPPGEYRFLLEAQQDGREFSDGPALTYHRDPRQDDGLWISPVLPWRLPPRMEAPSLEITQFSDAKVTRPEGWLPDGPAAIASSGSGPMVIQPNLEGLYAIYVTPVDRGCLISVGNEKMTRACKLDTEQFVTVADLTGQNVRIYGFDWIEKTGRKTGIRSIRFEPVTAAAAETLAKMGQPELHLTGIDDWMEYFHGGARLHRDQIYAILRGQQEVGLSAVAWSTGRSLVEYHSALPITTRFPARPLTSLEVEHPALHAYKSREAMINLLCPFRAALEDAAGLGLSLEAWLGMNRHYGADTLEGAFTSRWFAEHKDWRQWRKNAEKPNQGEACYYFEGVRAERLAILNELVSVGAQTLTLDTTRQVPMLLYHPEMVEAYVKETGRDPRTFGAENKDAYMHWIKWRSAFFTRLLRDLRASTAKAPQKVTINIRVPQLDLVTNLAMGLDIRTWLEEGLVDQMLLNPLETSQGEGLASIGDYQSLCKKHGVKLSVGVGATWMSRAGMAPGLRRAQGLQAAGMTRIDLYEAEYLAFLNEARWLPAVMGSRELMTEFQERSNLEACYPILPETACNGLDNHSRWLQTGWTLEGKGLNSL